MAQNQAWTHLVSGWTPTKGTWSATLGWGSALGSTGAHVWRSLVLILHVGDCSIREASMKGGQEAKESRVTAGASIGGTCSVFSGRTDGSSACRSGVPGRWCPDVRVPQAAGGVPATHHPGYHPSDHRHPSHHPAVRRPTYLVLWTLLTFWPESTKLAGIPRQ